MSVKGIYDAIKAALPETLQEKFLFGARAIVHGAGLVRIVMVPTSDSYSPGRARQGKSNPEELYSYEGSVSFDFVAPTHNDIDGAHGLRDLLISVCHRLFAGSFTPIDGAWDLESGASQAVKGEHYVLTIRFGQPVLKTGNDQLSPITTATPEAAPITGTFNDE
jgi:hypothetical protein